ncbi:hypothetical protein FEE95_21055 [Maribacter algarum]|uniref:Alpha/beta hydrolase n=1 Tax=Maribacter algarum (ex Zhang et al. 2020) TaxID=2578118 RepID=A0A5S3PG31_9FLAO|nr:hypothetical protein [Maribacter algarum]TMM52179.1 hypothetical protein FEE95_21055 [Maribacter algarum]
MKKIALKISVIIGLFLTIGFGYLEKEKRTKHGFKKISIKEVNYSPTVFPEDTTKLWMSEGSIANDTVLIMGDGGPTNQLGYDYNGKIDWMYLNSFKNYHFVSLHQSSTYNPDIFNWQKSFTLEDGIKEIDNSSEMMYRAIKYFKDRNKYVVVAGHSYSAFVVPHYIATRPSLADKYFMISGRLNADSLQTFFQLKGHNSKFEKDGKTLREPDTTRARPSRTERYYKIRKASEMLKAGLGIRKFTEELKTKDLSNLVVFYGKRDQNVGALSEVEIRFLKSKNAKVMSFGTDHYGVTREIIDLMDGGKLSF